MKKAIFILAMLLVSFVTIGQVTEKKTLYKSKQGFEITEKFEDGKSSLKYFYFSFQNKKYQHITDLGSLFFTTKEDLENFANKLIYFSDLENPENNLSTIIYSSDGKILGEFYKENRSTTHYSDLSSILITSTLSLELEAPILFLFINKL